MKNQYLIIFVTNIFLIACTTTPKSNNYSYSETGRWIASVEEKASAKESAIMFLTDQAISSCEAVDEILRRIERQQARGEDISVSDEDLKKAMLTEDSQGNVSLRNPDCKNKIYALAGVMCDGTNDNDPLCAAVRLRKQVDSAMNELQTADSATVQRTITQLTNEINEQKRKLQEQKRDDELHRATGKGFAVAYPFVAILSVGGLSFTPMAAGMLSGSIGFVPIASTVILGSLLVLEAGILLYSMVKAFDHCEDTSIERCRRRYFARTHNSVWTGVLQVPVKLMSGLVRLFKRGG